MSKKPIRIVKKNERLRSTKAADPEPINPLEHNPIEMARTVAAWIRESKKKGSSSAERVLSSWLRRPRPREA